MREKVKESEQPSLEVVIVNQFGVTPDSIPHFFEEVVIQHQDQNISLARRGHWAVWA